MNDYTFIFSDSLYIEDLTTSDEITTGEETTTNEDVVYPSVSSNLSSFTVIFFSVFLAVILALTVTRGKF